MRSSFTAVRESHVGRFSILGLWPHVASCFASVDDEGRVPGQRIHCCIPYLCPTDIKELRVVVSVVAGI